MALSLDGCKREFVPEIVLNLFFILNFNLATLKQLAYSDTSRLINFSYTINFREKIEFSNKRISSVARDVSGNSAKHWGLN